MWVDDYLHWNPADYGGVEEVRLDQKHVWIPDVMLYNTCVGPSYQRGRGLTV